ncbi:benzoylformate decarboxylase [Streptomyces blastmyceticus]|uniref:Benzoylformate decarboxylase n=1 Tax=Streptomyces blastmyceticus TaxID=68180 RepID=A0ABP3GI01_9ACTN
MVSASVRTSGPTVAEAAFDVLRDFGVTRVFGNPGSTEMHMYLYWPDDLEYVLALQEGSAVAMADGLAQRTRGPGVAIVHSAAGVGNALSSVIAAWRNQSPLVLLAGQQTRAMLPTEPYLSALEPDQFPRPYVKWALQPARAADVPGAIARALLTSLTPPYGPTFVSVPEDDWSQPAAPVPAHTIVPTLGADPATITRFADTLSSATRPALVVGPAVDGDAAAPDAVRLAERLGSAVYGAPWTSRASFPERHPLFQGFLTATREEVAKQLDGHDVVLVIGAQVFTYHVHTEGPFLPNGAQCLHLTDNPVHAFSAPIGDSLICSARAGIRALLDQLPDRPAHRTPPTAPPRPQPAPLTAPLEASAVLHLLRDLVPPTTPVFEEAPSYRNEIRAHFPMEAGQYHNTFSGGLGWALPAAVGAAMADPAHRTLCLIGDGSLMYSVQALWTAARHQLPLTVVVLDNTEYGAMKEFTTLYGIDAFPPPIQSALDLPALDIQAVATGLGITATHADDPSHLAETLTAALTARGPTLVDVRVQALRGTGPL